MENLSMESKGSVERYVRMQKKKKLFLDKKYQPMEKIKRRNPVADPADVG